MVAIGAGGVSGQTLLLKVEEAAVELRIGRSRMYALVGAGEVVSIKVGGSRRVPYAELVAYKDRLIAEQVGDFREAA
jgi:excisionase family DNA binding protein